MVFKGEFWISSLNMFHDWRHDDLALLQSVKLNNVVQGCLRSFDILVLLPVAWRYYLVHLRYAPHMSDFFRHFFGAQTFELPLLTTQYTRATSVGASGYPRNEQDDQSGGADEGSCRVHCCDPNIIVDGWACVITHCAISIQDMMYVVFLLSFCISISMSIMVR